MNIKSFVRKLDVRTPSLKQTVGNLSGGNQQKVRVANWLAAEAKILIVDEPTVGIDIVQDGDVTFWQGEYGGQTKPRGPLAGKKSPVSSAVNSAIFRRTIWPLTLENLAVSSNRRWHQNHRRYGQPHLNDDAGPKNVG